MQKRKSQIYRDSLEPYENSDTEELKYLEGSQAFGSRISGIWTWWFKGLKRKEGNAKGVEGVEDLPESIKSLARTIALQRVAEKNEENRAEEEEEKIKRKEEEMESARERMETQIAEVKDLLASLTLAMQKTE